MCLIYPALEKHVRYGTMLRIPLISYIDVRRAVSFRKLLQSYRLFPYCRRFILIRATRKCSPHYLSVYL